MQPITIGNFDYTQDEKGEWIYKARETAPIGKTPDRPKYREKPQYKLNEVIEGKSKNRFSKIINHTALELINYIKENLK